MIKLNLVSNFFSSERLELIEKGELKNTDSESDVESMNVSQVESEVAEVKVEKDNVKTQSATTVANDLLNNDFSSLSDSCLPELDLQVSKKRKIFVGFLLYLNLNIVFNEFSFCVCMCVGEWISGGGGENMNRLAQTLIFTLFSVTIAFKNC